MRTTSRSFSVCMRTDLLIGQSLSSLAPPGDFTSCRCRLRWVPPPVFFVVKRAKRLDPPEEVINLKKGGLLRVFSLNKWLVALFSPGAFHQKTEPKRKKNRKDKSR